MYIKIIVCIKEIVLHRNNKRLFGKMRKTIHSVLLWFRQTNTERTIDLPFRLPKYGLKWDTDSLIQLFGSKEQVAFF